MFGLKDRSNEQRRSTSKGKRPRYEPNQNWGRDYGVPDEDEQNLEQRNRDDFDEDYRYANQNFGRGGNTEGYTDFEYGHAREGFHPGHGRFAGNDGNYEHGARDWRAEGNISEYISAGVRGAGAGESYDYGQYVRGMDAREMERPGGAYSREARPSGKHAGKGPKGYRRSDERILEEVCEALTRDAHVDASEIDVSVDQGTVILKGTVESRRMKRHAEDTLEDIPGIRDVRNELSVAAHRHRPDFSASPHAHG